MTKNFTHERSLHVKRYLVLVLAVLMATVLLAAGCGGGGTSISGKYIYKAAPAGQGPVLRSVSTILRHLPSEFTVAPPRFPSLAPAWNNKKRTPPLHSSLYEDTTSERDVR